MIINLRSNNDSFQIPEAQVKPANSADEKGRSQTTVNSEQGAIKSSTTSPKLTSNIEATKPGDTKPGVDVNLSEEGKKASAADIAKEGVEDEAKADSSDEGSRSAALKKQIENLKEQIKELESQLKDVKAEKDSEDKRSREDQIQSQLKSLRGALTEASSTLLQVIKAGG